jgi:hypothetical protein
LAGIHTGIRSRNRVSNFIKHVSIKVIEPTQKSSGYVKVTKHIEDIEMLMVTG